MMHPTFPPALSAVLPAVAMVFAPGGAGPTHRGGLRRTHVLIVPDASPGHDLVNRHHATLSGDVGTYSRDSLGDEQ